MHMLACCSVAFPWIHTTCKRLVLLVSCEQTCATILLRHHCSSCMLWFLLSAIELPLEPDSRCHLTSQGTASSMHSEQLAGAATEVLLHATAARC
jgi:hypothetical protein